MRRERPLNARHDAESFAAAALPGQEDLRVFAIQIDEVYLPSHMTALHAGLQRLGLDEFDFSRDANITERLAAMRGHTGRGSFHELNTLCARSLSHVGPWRRGLADLPDGVENIQVSVASPVTGVTVLSMFFRFDEETARSISAPFQTAYRTRVHRTPLGAMTTDYAQGFRAAALYDLRSALNLRCQRWVTAHLPGVHAQLDTVAHAVELLTFKVGDVLCGHALSDYITANVDAPVFRPRIGAKKGEYLDLLNQSIPFRAWVNSQGLVRRTPHPKVAERAASIVLSGCIPDDDEPAYEDPDRLPLDNLRMALQNEHVVFSLLSLDHVLNTYEMLLGRVRDTLGDVKPARRRRALRQLRRLEPSIVRLALDARPLLRGIVGMDQHELLRESGRWRPMWFGGDRYEIDLVRRLHDRAACFSRKNPKCSPPRRVCSTSPQLRVPSQTHASTCGCKGSRSRASRSMHRQSPCATLCRRGRTSYFQHQADTLRRR